MMMQQRGGMSSGGRGTSRAILAIAFLICGVGGATLATPAQAATFTVTNNNDSGSGSLRQAMLDAGLDDAPDTIVFDADYTITIGGPLPVVTSSLTIQGNGAAGTVIRGGGGTWSTLEVAAPGELLIDSVTVSDGWIGIYNRGGNVTVTNSVVSGNYNRGLYNDGTLNMTSCTVSGNQSILDGGGIDSGGVLNLTNCTVSGNYAFYFGGGIVARGPATTIINSTISGNSVTISGGGISVLGFGVSVTVIGSDISDNTSAGIGGGISFEDDSSTLTIANSTIAGNSAVGQGGGIYNTGNSVTATNCTIAGNSAVLGAGIRNEWGSLTLLNTLVVENDCVGAVSAGTDCIATDATCDLATVLTAAEINLGPLADNGGPTWTMALGAGSVAIDAGDNAYAGDLMYDQRGAEFDRISGETVDVGAYEYQFLFYNFSGFFQPVDNLPIVNRAKAGQGIPIKFSLGGYQGMDILASGSPTSAPMACESGDPVDPIESVTAGNSGLSYDAATDTYTYVWRTSKVWAGTCRQLTVRMADGTAHVANFTFN